MVDAARLTLGYSGKLKKEFFMSLQTLLLALCVSLLIGCADPVSSSSPSAQVCQGFGCATKSNDFPSRAATHHPTKDEKIRVRRGEDPQFGSEEIRVHGSFPMHFFTSLSAIPVTQSSVEPFTEPKA